MEKFIFANGTNFLGVSLIRILLAQVATLFRISEPAIRFEHFGCPIYSVIFSSGKITADEFALVTALFLLLFDTTVLIRCFGI